MGQDTLKDAQIGLRLVRNNPVIPPSIPEITV